MPRILLAVGAVLCAVSAVAQSTVVIPRGLAAAEGNSTNSFPWGRGNSGLRLQNLYDSSHFTLQGITYPILITGLRWRPDTGTGLAPSTYPGNCQIRLSTCPVDHAAVTSTMANNQGANLTLCYSGSVSWGAQAAQAGPTPFGIHVPFQTSFPYDPNLGDLNIETNLPIQTFSGSLPQLDTQTVAPQASRVFLSTGYPGTGIGTVVQNHGLVVEVEYTPAAGLFATFLADVTEGPSPLAVQFTDFSYSSDPAGIASWAWDFDGDTVIDSTVRNPSFVYAGCGDYHVTLTITDASHPPATFTRTAYVRTDHITAGFTAAVATAPNTYQFTDTTTPPATSWAWDFDGDLITDSTLQNPTAVLPLCQPSHVRLQATRNCRTSVATQTLFPAPGNLSTLFAGGVNGAASWTAYFDAAVLAPQGLAVCGLATNVTAAAGTPFSVAAYVAGSSYLGVEGQVAAWRPLGTATGIAAGANQPSSLTFATPVYLPAGTYGLALRHLGAAPSFTVGPLGPYGNSDLVLTLGAARATLAGPFTGGSTQAQRIWNGTLHYTPAAGSGAAGYGFFQAGCPGTLGVSRLTASGQPQLGTTLAVTIDNLPLSAAVMITGFSNTASIFGPLPFDVAPFGAPGCFGRVSTDASQFLFGAANAAVWNFGIPNAAGLLGVQMYNQALVLDPTWNSLGGVLSDAAGLLIGT